MKKFLTLMAVLGLGYFVSIGCIYKNDPPKPFLKNKIVSIYHDSTNIVFLGETYSYYLDGSHTQNDYLKDSKDEIVIFNHIVEENGAYIKIEEDVGAGNMKEDGTEVMVEFGLSIMIDTQEASASLIGWAKGAHRTVVDRYEGSKAIYKEKTVFYEERGLLRSHITLSGVAYKSDVDYLSTASRLDIPFILSMGDFGISKIEAFPSSKKAKSEDLYIKHLGVKIQPRYQEPTVTKAN